MLFLQSCSNKEVQLPTIKIEGIHEIQNHSSIWIFFETVNQDTIAVLNKNNKLINTHWIFNIDKRLSMHKIVPLLQKMQENRNKDSMHKKEGMLNYFSFADLASNNISLIEFNQTTFISSTQEYRNFIEKIMESQIIELEIQNGKLYINHSEIEPNLMVQEINKLKSSNVSTQPQIILTYHKNTSFQNYLHIKALLFKEELTVNNTEFIFNFK